MYNIEIEGTGREVDHVATGAESLREFANNAGMDQPDVCWLLDSRDAWIKNPFFSGVEELHPEAGDGDFFDSQLHGPFLPAPPFAPAAECFVGEDPIPF